MLNNLDVVFRLKQWAVYRRKGKFYISDQERVNTTKSYKTLRHACNAIARKLECE